MKNYDYVLKQIKSRVSKVMSEDNYDNWLKNKKTWVEILQPKQAHLLCEKKIVESKSDLKTINTNQISEDLNNSRLKTEEKTTERNQIEENKNKSLSDQISQVNSNTDITVSNKNIFKNKEINSSILNNPPQRPKRNLKGVVKRNFVLLHKRKLECAEGKDSNSNEFLNDFCIETEKAKNKLPVISNVFNTDANKYTQNSNQIKKKIDPGIKNSSNFSNINASEIISSKTEKNEKKINFYNESSKIYLDRLKIMQDNKYLNNLQKFLFITKKDLTSKITRATSPKNVPIEDEENKIAKKETVNLEQSSSIIKMVSEIPIDSNQDEKVEHILNIINEFKKIDIIFDNNNNYIDEVKKKIAEINNKNLNSAVELENKISSKKQQDVQNKNLFKQISAVQENSEKITLTLEDNENTKEVDLSYIKSELPRENNNTNQQVLKTKETLKLDEISSFMYYSKMNCLNRDIIYTSILNSYELMSNNKFLSDIFKTNMKKMVDKNLIKSKELGIDVKKIN